MKKQMIIALLLAALTAYMIKCNGYLLRHSPFEVFDMKNMRRETKKNLTTIFISSQMPKGNHDRLTNNGDSKGEKFQFDQKNFKTWKYQ